MLLSAAGPFGTEVAVGRESERPGEYQHQGFGRRLVERAERAAAEAGFRRLFVMSAIGTREYYSRLGFARDGPHMAKPIFT